MNERVLDLARLDVEGFHEPFGRVGIRPLQGLGERGTGSARDGEQVRDLGAELGLGIGNGHGDVSRLDLGWSDHLWAGYKRGGANLYGND